MQLSSNTHAPFLALEDLVSSGFAISLEVVYVGQLPVLAVEVECKGGRTPGERLWYIGDVSITNLKIPLARVQQFCINMYFYERSHDTLMYRNDIAK